MVIFCFLLFTFCSTPDEASDIATPSQLSADKISEQVNSGPSFTIGTVNNGDATITSDITDIQAGFVNYWLLQYPNGTQNLPLETPEIIVSTDGTETHYYLAMSVGITLNGESHSGLGAVELKEENGVLSLVGDPISHTCTQNKCTSCEFTYNTIKQIDGCNCKKTAPGETNGWCGHSISSGLSPGSLAAELVDALGS